MDAVQRISESLLLYHKSDAHPEVPKVQNLVSKKKLKCNKKLQLEITIRNKRKKEIKRLRLLDNKNHYTKEELDAMDYFNGTGFYQKEQDPKQKPNIFDTRQTFLLKMHNPILRNNFLNSLNSRSR